MKTLLLIASLGLASVYGHKLMSRLDRFLAPRGRGNARERRAGRKRTGRTLGMRALLQSIHNLLFT